MGLLLNTYLYTSFQYGTKEMCQLQVMENDGDMHYTLLFHPETTMRGWGNNELTHLNMGDKNYWWMPISMFASIMILWGLIDHEKHSKIYPNRMLLQMRSWVLIIPVLCVCAHNIFYMLIRQRSQANLLRSSPTSWGLAVGFWWPTLGPSVSVEEQYWWKN